MFDDTKLEPCTFKGKKRKVKLMKRDSKRGNLPLRRLGGFGDFTLARGTRGIFVCLFACALLLGAPANILQKDEPRKTGFIGQIGSDS
ncbi:hypothetical protein C943_01432 [Mariniradius saccharolyticus AK6]|uniref:Uncharacterized protein n=1 Tax=Mariniradius saccharolyticus AK6 TaxID=1239962 RepID=M7X3V5_9BACT|nr:hypothetical protein C943_01432 [Mariniradius saccharolyticus AK6]